MTNGLDRIAAAFAHARREGRSCLMPYYTLGYPNAETSLAVLRALAGHGDAGGGADLIELGLPFSDPLADGPTIQASAQKALARGMTTSRCLEMVGHLRAQGISQPLLLMGYVNPILSYGLGRFVADAAAAGADGFIVPDLPLEEAGEMESACREQGCALVYLLAPGTTDERVAAIAAHASGFLYLVSLTGVTGARQSLPPGLAGYVARVRAACSLPLAVGFGISSPQQAAQVGRLADGVIVGSALIQAVATSPDPSRAAVAFLQGLRAAMAPAAPSRPAPVIRSGGARSLPS